MNQYILIFQCADKKGIVARIADFIFQQEGNIIAADQYSTDPENGHFFMRVEFYAGKGFSMIHDAFVPIAQDFEASWKIHEKDQRLRMGIMVSQPDHCLFDLLYAQKSGDLEVSIPFVVSNCADHADLVRQFGIPFHHIPAMRDDKKEAEILACVREESDFLVLARYMQILSADFLQSYGKDIINIHHSFLPSFKGAGPYQQAHDKGVKVIGATAHFVTAGLDEGPIITQVVEPVTHKDGPDDLAKVGKHLENRALRMALHKYVDYRIMEWAGRTIIF